MESSFSGKTIDPATLAALATEQGLDPVQVHLQLAQLGYVTSDPTTGAAVYSLAGLDPASVSAAPPAGAAAAASMSNAVSSAAAAAAAAQQQQQQQQQQQLQRDASGPSAAVRAAQVHMQQAYALSNSLPSLQQFASANPWTQAQQRQQQQQGQQHLRQQAGGSLSLTAGVPSAAAALARPSTAASAADVHVAKQARISQDRAQVTKAGSSAEGGGGQDADGGHDTGGGKDDAYDVVRARDKKRLEQNREAAKRFRQKKNRYMEELKEQNLTLLDEKTRLQAEAAALAAHASQLEMRLVESTAAATAAAAAGGGSAAAGGAAAVPPIIGRVHRWWTSVFARAAELRAKVQAQQEHSDYSDAAAASELRRTLAEYPELLKACMHSGQYVRICNLEQCPHPYRLVSWHGFLKPTETIDSTLTHVLDEASAAVPSLSALRVHFEEQELLCDHHIVASGAYMRRIGADPHSRHALPEYLPYMAAHLVQAAHLHCICVEQLHAMLTPHELLKALLHCIEAVASFEATAEEAMRQPAMGALMSVNDATQQGGGGGGGGEASAPAANAAGAPAAPQAAASGAATLGDPGHSHGHTDTSVMLATAQAAMALMAQQGHAVAGIDASALEGALQAGAAGDAAGSWQVPGVPRAASGTEGGSSALGAADSGHVGQPSAAEASGISRDNASAPSDPSGTQAGDK